MTTVPHACCTLTGRWIDVLNLDPGQVHMDDVARGLAYTCRWAGQMPAYYSVAEHSFYVAVVLTDAYRAERAPNPYLLYRAALLHDAAEAYMGDIPSPYKKLVRFAAVPEAEGGFDPYKEVEDRMLRVIFAVAGCPWPDVDEWADIKAADLIVRDAEQRLRTSWSERRGGTLPELHEREHHQITEAYDRLDMDVSDTPEIRCWNPDRARTTWLTELHHGASR
jgi:uncharacterized protein